MDIAIANLNSLTIGQLLSDAAWFRARAKRFRERQLNALAQIDECRVKQIEKAIRIRRIQLKRKRNRNA